MTTEARPMTSAFVSYAHEDQEFVIRLVERLEAQGLVIHYDKVVLLIGDSLTEKISQAITDGDFLIAIVSPASVQSEWCKRELALAKAQGINQRKVKVLPVRYRAAAMPPMLQDTYYVDADGSDHETIARRLADSMREHLGGRAVRAATDSEQVEEAQGAPAHTGTVDEANIAAIDDVRVGASDVLTAAEGVGCGPVAATSPTSGHLSAFSEGRSTGSRTTSVLGFRSSSAWRRPTREPTGRTSSETPHSSRFSTKTSVRSSDLHGDNSLMASQSCDGGRSTPMSAPPPSPETP
jgi:TIR domain